MNDDYQELEFILSDTNDYYILFECNEYNQSVVVIPDTYKGLPVKAIDAFCFSHNKIIEEVIVGNNIETIGDCAFIYCSNMKRITLPKKLKVIGNRAFECCKKLERLYITSNVEELGVCLFVECDELEEVIVDTKNQHFKSSEGAIYSKDGKVLIMYVNQDADVYEIPDEVEIIKRNSLEMCEIEHLYIGKGLKYIEEGALNGCSFLRWISVSNENEHFISVDGVLYSKDLKKLLKYPSLKNTVEYKLLKETEVIGHSAFDNCLELEKVIVEDNVKVIERAAFNNCENLLEIKLSKNLEVIGVEAFKNCYELNPITIPKSVKKIGDGAFLCVCGKTIIFEHDESFKKYLDENCEGWDFNEEITNPYVVNFKLIFNGKKV